MDGAIAMRKTSSLHAVGSIPARRNARGSGRSVQAGVGLIEVLVAVLIISIAFLGIAALQAMALSTNSSAMARSMATISSYSILDAMRDDLLNAQAGSYNTGSPTTIVGNACPAAGSSLASYQLNKWCGQLGQNLGVNANTTGAINCSAVGDCTVTITFQSSSKDVGGSSTQTVVTRAML